MKKTKDEVFISLIWIIKKLIIKKIDNLNFEKKVL